MSCQWHQTSKPGPLCLSGRRQCWRAGCQRPCSPFPGFHRFFSSKSHLKAMFPRLPPPLRATSRLPLHQRTISRQPQLRPATSRFKTEFINVLVRSTCYHGSSKPSPKIDQATVAPITPCLSSAQNFPRPQRPQPTTSLLPPPMPTTSPLPPPPLLLSSSLLLPLLPSTPTHTLPQVDSSFHIYCTKHKRSIKKGSRVI